MSKILDFFTGGWIRWALLAALIAGGVLFLRYHWIHVGREQVLAENVSVAVKIIYKQGETTERVVTKYIKIAAKTKEAEKKIETEVINYVETNPGVCLDPEWRRLHDGSAANAVPAGER